jgi:hypothetical protein
MEVNCPFYGRHMYISHSSDKATLPLLLLAEDGNQCGLVVYGYSPCWMEINKEAIDWARCPRVDEVRVESKV